MGGDGLSGYSQNGVIDPVGNGPTVHATLWTERALIDVGTLGAGYLSGASYVNDSGQIVGQSTINTDPDPYSFLGTSFHTFLWQNSGAASGYRHIGRSGCRP